MAAFGRRAGDQPGHHGIPRDSRDTILNSWHLTCAAIVWPPCFCFGRLRGGNVPLRFCGASRRSWLQALAWRSGSWHQAYLIPSLSGATAGWRDFPLGGVSEEEIQRIRRHEKASRPLGNDGFVGKLEETLGRILQRQKPGRKRRHKQKQVYCPPITRLAPGSQLPLEGHALFERELNT